MTQRHCDPNAGRGQGRDCLRSQNATRAALRMKPLEGETCSACQNIGTCIAPAACEQPELQPIRRRLFTERRRPLLPQTREEWGRFIGGSLGVAGSVYIANAVARYLGLW